MCVLTTLYIHLAAASCGTVCGTGPLKCERNLKGSVTKGWFMSTFLFLGFYVVPDCFLGLFLGVIVSANQFVIFVARRYVLLGK